jgi:hypothetical protein
MRGGYLFSLPKSILIGIIMNGILQGLSNTPPDLLGYMANKRGWDNADFLNDYADQVAWQESRNRNIAQDNGGPARGVYQIEGYDGSSRNDTVIQRAINFYNDNPEAPRSEEMNNILGKIGTNLDFTSVDPSVQKEIFMIDAYQGLGPLDDLKSGKISPFDFWANYWNQSKDPKNPGLLSNWNNALNERK